MLGLAPLCSWISLGWHTGWVVKVRSKQSHSNSRFSVVGRDLFFPRPVPDYGANYKLGPRVYQHCCVVQPSKLLARCTRRANVVAGAWPWYKVQTTEARGRVQGPTTVQARVVPVNRPWWPGPWAWSEFRGGLDLWLVLLRVRPWS